MRVLSFLTLTLTLTAAGLTGCALDEDRFDEETFSRIEAPVETYAASPGCHYKCKPCPPNLLCIQVCQPVGQCGNQCNILGLCLEGYEWSSTACRCLPAKDGCTYGGHTYQVGQSFPDSDGCNTCTCNEGGLIACTEKACIQL